MRCGMDVAEAPGCEPGAYMDGAGGFYEAVPFGGTGTGPACPDCGAVRGEPHHIHCSVEPCPKCGGQIIGCSCRLAWRPAALH